MIDIVRMILLRFHRDDKGAAMIEYGLLVALIAVVCATAIGTTGAGIGTLFTNIATWVGNHSTVG